jgi:signal peptidase I
MSNFFTLRRQKKKLKQFIKHVRHIVHVDDDILDEKVKTRLDEVIIEAESIDREDESKIVGFLKDAPERVSKVLPKKSSPLIREWVDIIAVAVMVAFGIRALFLQPFKIPTSSMQPTLFGIHYIEKKALPDLPSFLEGSIFGVERAKLIVKETGRLDTDSIQPFVKYKLFPWTEFKIGDISYSLPGEPKKVNEYALHGNTFYEKGEELCNGWLSTGDHLFVDRFSHHFLGLRRGDVVVFNTEDIVHNYNPLIKRGYYYIKRLVGLPGDAISIRNDMVFIKPAGEGKECPITELCPAFKKIYSRKGGYHGHLNLATADYLSDSNSTFIVPDNSYFVLGDNSDSSFDSRYWGVVPRKNIVGKGFFVFWPYSRRWGLVDSKPPLDVPTKVGFPAMNLQ